MGHPAGVTHLVSECGECGHSGSKEDPRGKCRFPPSGPSQKLLLGVKFPKTAEENQADPLILRYLHVIYSSYLKTLLPINRSTSNATDLENESENKLG